MTNLNKLVKEGKLVIIKCPKDFDYEYFYDLSDSEGAGLCDSIVLEDSGIIICTAEMVEQINEAIAETLEATEEE